MNQKDFLYWLTWSMSLLYALIGLFILISPKAAEALPGWKHYGLGLLLIFYSAYRLMRLKKLSQMSKNASKEA